MKINRLCLGEAVRRWLDHYSEKFFFFSSRRRHTRFDCDWSSDVCSSDLAGNIIGSGIFVIPASLAAVAGPLSLFAWVIVAAGYLSLTVVYADLACAFPRSEERRGGKECRSRGSPYH